MARICDSKHGTLWVVLIGTVMVSAYDGVCMSRSWRSEVAEASRRSQDQDSPTLRSVTNWPHWRGLTRNGIVAEDSGWSAGHWPPKSPLWRKEVGSGATSPLVVDDRLYSMGWRDGQDTVFCLDAATGGEIWKRSYPCPGYGRWAVGDKGYYKGPTSTPEYDPATGYLFTLSIDGDLNCWDTRKKGEHRWHTNLYEKFRVRRRPRVSETGQQRDYGYTTAPFVHGEWVIVEAGAETGNLVAFDKKTGLRSWVSEHKDAAGHTGGPVPMAVDGIPCLAILTLTRLVVTRLDAGKAGLTVATFPWTTAFGNNIATPAVFENNVVLTSGYNQGAICRIRITPGLAEEIWRKPYASKVCSPIIHKGYVYWAWRKLRCLDFETGVQKWAGGRFGDPGSCIVTGDDRIIVWGHQGKLALVETFQRSQDSYQELAVKNRVMVGKPWPHVILSWGRLHCKNQLGTIESYVVGSPTGPPPKPIGR